MAQLHFSIFRLIFFCNLIFLKCYLIFSYSNHRGYYTPNIHHFDIVVPVRLCIDGHQSHRRLLQDTKHSGEVHYMIPINGRDYHVELWPNTKMVTPGMVVESHGPRNVHAPNHNMDHIKIRRSDTIACHFVGVVRGLPDSKATLSNCNGLAGVLALDKERYYMIEPMENHNRSLGDQQPHLLYDPDFQRTIDNASSRSCAVKSSDSKLNNVPIVNRRSKRSQTGYLDRMYMEVLVVLDKTLVDYHKDFDLENYVLTCMNMVNYFYNDASFGAPLEIAIARMIRLEDEKHEMNLKMTPNAFTVLTAFNEYQQKMQVGDDSHPNHHDVALLLTKIDICDENDCGLLGLAKMDGTCDPKNCAAIVEDCGLKMGIVIAHELAHTLGVIHDLPDESGCPTNNPEDNYFYVMAPGVSIKTKEWSPCTRNYIYQYIDAGLSKCLLDRPVDHNFPHRNIPAGAVYGVAYQCRLLLSEQADVCDDNVVCNNMRCRVPGYGCQNTKLPLAIGTSCGVGLKGWCINGECVPVGTSKGVDGGWGEWGEWSSCSRTCGGGVAISRRGCDSPRPAKGGLFCIGQRARHKMCNIEPCDLNKPSFRDVQCAEFNSIDTGDGSKDHKWNAYYMHSSNPCNLYCLNEKNVLSMLKPAVVDGTPCGRGERDICLGASCLKVPCDMDFNSNAVEDSCGVCNGDSLSCTLKHGSKDFPKKKGLSRVMEIPTGTVHLRIEEMKPTSCVIQLRNSDGKQTYTTGSLMGKFAIPGGYALIGSAAHKQEFVLIKGPTTDKISVWVSRSEDVVLSWTFALPVAGREPNYEWRETGWAPCSSHCGSGTQTSEVRCVEAKGGTVSEIFCKGKPKPSVETKACENRECHRRWCINEWKECNDGIKKRLVQCCQYAGEGEGQTTIVSDSKCKYPKPAEQEECERGRSKTQFGTKQPAITKATNKPSTYKPSTYKPSTYKPSTYKPSTYKPSTYKPSTSRGSGSGASANIFIRMWRSYVRFVMRLAYGIAGVITRN